MRKLLSLTLFALCCCASAFAQGGLSGVNGDCAIGGQQVITQGLQSSGTQPIGTTTVSSGSGVEASYPNCSVTVYLTGTLTKASIFSNNLSSPTVLGNPFTANVDSSWLFFAAPTACYDITLQTGTGPTLPETRTFADVCLGTAAGAGTVTIIASQQTVGVLLTTTVTNATTTPLISYTLTAAPAYTVWGNNQSTPGTPQYVSIVTQMLPFAYSGNTLQLATVGVTLSHTAGTVICEDSIGNLKDTGCNNVTGVSSFNGRTGPVLPQTGDYMVSQVTGAAPLASPAFTGAPTAPTPLAGDTSSQIPNDTWVSSYFAVLNSPAFSGIPTAPTASTGTNTTQLATTAFVIAQIGSGGYAPINSPAFTGVPTAPTPAQNTNTTQLATTAFVLGQASSLTPIVDGIGNPGSSFLYARADHIHPTDSSRAPINNPNFTGTVIAAAFNLTGSYTDSLGSTGSSGNILSSTGTATKWIAASSSGTVTSVDGSASEGAETVVSGSVAPITASGSIRGTIKWATVTGPQAPVDSNRGQAWLNADAGSDTYTLTTPSGSNFQNGWYFWVKNGSATGTITFQTSGGTTIDGSTTLVEQAHSVIMIGSDGTNYHSLVFSPVGNNSADLVFASPCGSSGTPGMRALCSSDIPSSVALTGVPTAPTASPGTNTTQLATTAFAAASFAPLANPSFSGTVTIPTAAVTTFSGTPNFSGAATGQTATTSDNSTKLATTAFVQANLANYLPLAGGTMTGKLVTVASATGGAGFNLPPGTAPTSPVNGDCWTTTAGLFCQINGSTVGPYATSAGSGANAALSNLASVAINTALLPGSNNSIALGSASFYWSNAFSTALNCGLGGTTSCVVTGNGSTSGNATITWPAVAGTTTNAIASSNTWQAPTFNATVASTVLELSGSKFVVQPDGDNTSFAGGIGALAVQSSTSLDNTAVGYDAANGITSGANSTAVGALSLESETTSGGNTAVGYQALTTATSAGNTATGTNAGEFISSGADNTATGNGALQGVTGTHTTGANNTADGFQSLTACQGACHDNTAVGFQAGNNITTGIENTLVGSGTATNAGADTNEIVLGYNLTGAGSNTMTLGGVVKATGIGTPSTSTVTIPGTLALTILGQAAASDTGGSCTMTSGTTCTLGLGHTYTTPICIAVEQGSGAIAGSCSVATNVATVTAASSNSATWGILVFGNPT